jgi:hypothetical protein
LRLNTMGITSTCVPRQCEPSLHSQMGVLFDDEVIGVLTVIVRATSPFTRWDLGNGGVSATMG